MAKKKATKKSGKPTPEDHAKAMVASSLKRAAASVEKSMTAKVRSIDPGSYPVELTIDISGELLVEAPGRPGAPRTVPVFGLGELLVAMMAGRTEHVISQHVERGLSVLKIAHNGGARAQTEAQADMKQATEILERVVGVGAQKLRLTETKQTPARAGAVKGLPGVGVNGTVGQREVSVEVEAGGD